MKIKEVKKNFAIVILCLALFFLYFLSAYSTEGTFRKKRQIRERDLPCIEIPMPPANVGIDVFKNPKKIVVMGWNIENLFDTQDDPFTEDDEFTPRGEARWDNASLRNKLYNITDIIRRINHGSGPDIIGLCEVENRKVVEMLSKHPNIKHLQYKYIYHRDSVDPRGIDVAILSRYSASVRWEQAYPGARDMLVGKFEIQEHPLYILVNHWRSRLGGKKKTEDRRIQAALKCIDTVKKIQSQDPDADILLIGDFNDNPQDSSIRNYLKAVPYNKRENKRSLLYNLTPSAKTEEWVNLTSYFDQIIVSQGILDKKGFSYIPGSFEIISYSFMCDKNGRPLSFSSYDGKGYSDHFPVVATFQIE